MFSQQTRVFPRMISFFLFHKKGCQIPSALVWSLLDCHSPCEITWAAGKTCLDYHGFPSTGPQTPVALGSSFFVKFHFCVCLLLQGLHKALFLLPASWMLAGITGDSQTPVSGGEDTRPDVTFVATSNPATCSCPPPSWSLLAFLSRQRSSWTPDSNPFQLYGMERWLRMSLPELSRNQVLRSSLWQLSQRRASWAQYTPRTEGQSPVLLFSN